MIQIFVDIPQYLEDLIKCWNKRLFETDPFLIKKLMTFYIVKPEFNVLPNLLF